MSYRLLWNASELLAKYVGTERVEQNLEVEQPRTVAPIIKVVLQPAQHLFHGVSIAVVSTQFRAPPFERAVGSALN